MKLSETDKLVLEWGALQLKARLNYKESTYHVLCAIMEELSKKPPIYSLADYYFKLIDQIVSELS